MWKMPGGGVEKGEDPSAAAEREVIEEVRRYAHSLACGCTLTSRSLYQAGLKGTVVQALGVYQVRTA